MDPVKVTARAKLNLTLDVLGRRPDGYHDLRMVMHSVRFGDTLTIRQGGGDGVCVRSDLSFLPSDGRNLAAAAALTFWQETGLAPVPLEIGIEKRIPVCAGLGGGSSDAAAVLHALNRMFAAGLSDERLAEIGSRVGSDVPYCVLGGTALAEGRGERLTRLPALPGCWAVICKPGFSVSTPELFQRIDAVALRRRPDTKGVLQALEQGDLAGVARRMYNVFEDALPDRCAAEIAQIRGSLIQNGALGAVMSGTGSAVFGLFAQEESAAAACRELARYYPEETFLTQTV